MLNKIVGTMKANEMVVVVYREGRYNTSVASIVEAVNNNNTGKLLGTEADYKIDSFKKVDGKLEVTVTRTSLVIDKASVVDNLIDVIQQKDKGMSHIQLVLDSIKEYDTNGNVIKQEDKNYVGFIKLPENLASRHGVFKFEECVLRDGKNHIRIKMDSKNPATKEILSVKYGSDEEQGKLVLKHGLFMHEDRFGQYKFYRKQSIWLVGLECNTKIKYADILADPNNDNSGIINGWKKYVTFGASPSNERQKVIYMIDVTNGYKRAHGILSKLTYGAYDIELVGTEVSYDQLAKASTRWFQWMAPSTNLGRINCYAIYQGKFNEDKIDGMAWMSSEAFARMVFEKFGYKVDASALNGMFNQSRLTLSKVGTMPVPQATTDKMIEHLDAEPVRFAFDELTPGIIKDIKNGVYTGKVIIFGDGPVEAFYDKNGMKADYDYSIERPEFNLLRILRSNESNFSKSIFEKMLAKNKNKTVEIATNLLVEDVFAKVEKTYIDPKPSVLSPETFTKESWFMDEIISNMFPTYLKSDKNLSLNVVDNITKAVNKKLNKFKVPMSGKNSGIVVGIEAMFNIDSFIGDHEVFCSAAERMIAKKEKNGEKVSWKVFVIKYPSMDINEYSVANVITKKEIKARIKAAFNSGLISKDLMNVFIEYYMTLHDSVMVVPACELFKNLHAGSDFDTDQVSWSINEDIIEVLDSNEKIAVVIK